MNWATKILLIIIAIAIAGFLFWKNTNNNNQTTTNEPKPQPLEQSSQDMQITYPSGGETFNTNNSITIRYVVSSNLQNKLTSQDTTELYLIDKNGAVTGFISEVNPTQQAYNWNPIDLGHWAGLDIIRKEPNTGEYRVMIVSRKKIQPPQDIAGDYPVDIFADSGTKYSEGKVAVTGNNGITTYKNVISATTSDTFNLTVTPKPALKIYNSTTYNYQLNYRANLTPTINPSYLTLLNDDLQNVSFADNKKQYQRERPFDFYVSVADNSQYLTYTKWFVSKKLFSNQDELNKVASQSSFDGGTLVDFWPEGVGGRTVYIFHKNHVVVLSQGDMTREDFQEVVSSFKFTK